MLAKLQLLQDGGPSHRGNQLMNRELEFLNFDFDTHIKPNTFMYIIPYSGQDKMFQQKKVKYKNWAIFKIFMNFGPWLSWN